MKWLCRLAAACVAVVSLVPAQSRSGPALPGWRVGAPARLNAAAALPRPDAAVMSEFGLQSLDRATARRGGSRAAFTAFRFRDSYGAYGAFTYLRQPDSRPLALAPGVLAASGNGRILLTQGAWLIAFPSAASQPPSAALAAARRMARALAPAGGSPFVLPTVVYQLPRAGFQPGSRRYAEGPLAFAAACSWVPPALIGFDRSAEAVVGAYTQGVAMAIVSYPTPQIATAHFAALAALPGVRARRSGSLIALVHGADAAAAAPLLAAVRYQADLTMVPPAPVGLDALPSLLLSVFTLCGMIFAVAVVVGILAGGTRVLLNQVLPRRYHRFAQENLVQLHLGQGLPTALVNQRK